MRCKIYMRPLPYFDRGRQVTERLDATASTETRSKYIHCSCILSRVTISEDVGVIRGWKERERLEKASQSVSIWSMTGKWEVKVASVAAREL